MFYYYRNKNYYKFNSFLCLHLHRAASNFLNRTYDLFDNKPYGCFLWHFYKFIIIFNFAYQFLFYLLFYFYFCHSIISIWVLCHLFLIFIKFASQLFVDKVIFKYLIKIYTNHLNLLFLLCFKVFLLFLNFFKISSCNLISMGSYSC